MNLKPRYPMVIVQAEDNSYQSQSGKVKASGTTVEETPVTKGKVLAIPEKFDPNDLKREPVEIDQEVGFFRFNGTEIQKNVYLIDLENLKFTYEKS